jgi:hypothetical protein
VLAVGLDVNGLDLREVAHEVGPGDVGLLLVEPTLQVDLEPQGEEAHDDVADRVAVGVVVDRADIEDGLLGSKRALDAPERLVGGGDLRGREVRVRGEHERAVEAGIAGDRVLVDRYRTLLDAEEAGEALVADDGLGAALGERLRQLCDERGTRGGVLLDLDLVACRSEPGSMSRWSAIAKTQRSMSNWNRRPLASRAITSGRPCRSQRRPKTSGGPQALAVRARRPDARAFSTTASFSLNIERLRSRPSSSPDATSASRRPSVPTIFWRTLFPSRTERTICRYWWASPLALTLRLDRTNMP